MGQSNPSPTLPVPITKPVTWGSGQRAKPRLAFSGNLTEYRKSTCVNPAPSAPPGQTRVRLGGLKTPRTETGEVLRAEQEGEPLSAGLRASVGRVLPVTDKSLTEGSNFKKGFFEFYNCRNFSPPWPGSHSSRNGCLPRQEREVEGVHVVADKARTKGSITFKACLYQPYFQPLGLTSSGLHSLQNRTGWGCVGGIHVRFYAVTDCQQEVCKKRGELNGQVPHHYRLSTGSLRPMQ